MNAINFKAKARQAAAAILTFCMLWLTGCWDTKDDRSVCTVDMTFRFEYTLNEHSTDMFGATAESVDIYIYDEKGSFVKMVNATRAGGTLAADNRVTVNLVQGYYTAVAWTNLQCGDYETVYECHISQKRVSLKTNGGKVSATPGDLMHGITAFTASNANSAAGDIPVSMTKNTNNIKVILNVKNSPVPVSADMFDMSITGSNGAYKFDNSFGECSPFTYIPQYSMPGTGVVQGEFNVLRLLQSDDLLLSINREGTRAEVSLPMTDMLTKAIMQHPTYTSDADLDRYDRYVLEYDVDFSGGGPALIVMIKINDWIVVDWNGPVGQ